MAQSNAERQKKYRDKKKREQDELVRKKAKVILRKLIKEVQ